MIQRQHLPRRGILAMPWPSGSNCDFVASSGHDGFYPQKQTYGGEGRTVMKGHVWTAPAVQEESDLSAKRSGAAMYPACLRMED